MHKLKILKQDFQALQPQGGHCRLEVSREEIFEVSYNLFHPLGKFSRQQIDEKEEKYVIMLSAENFTQSIKHLRGLQQLVSVLAICVKLLPICAKNKHTN